jgi:hypothetical protein
MRRPIRSARVATLCLQGDTTNTTKDNPGRLSILEEAVSRLGQQADWHPLDAFLLPGGYFRLSRPLGTRSFEQRKRRVEAERFFPAIVEQLTRLQPLSPDVRLVLGVMARARHKAERTEQACIAFDRSGIIGLARKIFPTAAETRGRRFMSPCIEDYSAGERFISLPNGGRALLNSCYDLFGAANAVTSAGARRLAIRALRRGAERLTYRDECFGSERDKALAAWATMIARQAPDVLLASIHGFERPGLDGYWQRHGIARASAGFKGALALGAADFGEGLPSQGSTLAAANVPQAALSAGVRRRAYSLAPDPPGSLDRQGGPPGTAPAVRATTWEGLPGRGDSSHGFLRSLPTPWHPDVVSGLGFR